MSDIELRLGLPSGQEARAAALYDDAFGRKMRPVAPLRSSAWPLRRLAYGACLPTYEARLS